MNSSLKTHGSIILKYTYFRKVERTHLFHRISFSSIVGKLTHRSGETPFYARRFLDSLLELNPLTLKQSQQKPWRYFFSIFFVWANSSYSIWSELGMPVVMFPFHSAIIVHCDSSLEVLTGQTCQNFWTNLTEPLLKMSRLIFNSSFILRVWLDGKSHLL